MLALTLPEVSGVGNLANLKWPRDYVLKENHCSVFHTDLLVIETESSRCFSCITDKSDSNHIPGCCEWWRFVSGSVKHDSGCLVMACVVHHQEIFSSLGPEFSKVESDFLVHWNLYLPRAVFVVAVIAWVV